MAANAHHDLLGTHVSIAGGVDLAPFRARLLGCSAMQIFTKGNRQWSGPPISDESAKAFRAAMGEHEIDAAFAHATYLINPAAPDPIIAKKSVDALTDEIERCEQLGLPGIVLHPGAHLGRGVKRGIAAIAKRLKEVLKRTRGCRAAIYLENVAGQGSTIGRTFEELAEIRERAGAPDRIACCIDTCHLLAAGHDIRTPAAYAETMDHMGGVLGFDAVHAIHLNDSKMPFDSRRDRHEHIGRGEVGLSAFHSLLNDPRFARVPKVLETSKREDCHEDIANLRVLRRLVRAKGVSRRPPSWRLPAEQDAQRLRRMKKGR
jgi:deoxyribonuclease-4